jgi:alkanesulfonate monooxygenase
MPVAFTCVPGTSQIHLPRYPEPSDGTLARIDQAFGAIVIDGPAGLLGNMDVAAEAAKTTSALRIALTHWAGVMHPCAAAEQIARLDRLASGRLVLRFLSAPDGHVSEAMDHVDALRQTDEYIVLLKRLWANREPFDHEGPHYSVSAGVLETLGPQAADIPIRMSGASGAAIDVAGRHATVFELAGGRYEGIRNQMARVTAAASRHGRADKISFALPVLFSNRTRVFTAVEGEPVHLAGPVSRITQDLLGYASLGVDEFMVSGVDRREELEAFARDVAPVFQGTVPIRAARRHARPGFRGASPETRTKSHL